MTIPREAETVAQAVEGAERDFPQLVIVSARQIVPFPNPSWDELRKVLDEAFGDEPALTTNVRDAAHAISRRMILPATADTAAPVTVGPVTIGDGTFVVVVDPSAT